MSFATFFSFLYSLIWKICILAGSKGKIFFAGHSDLL